MGARRPEDGDNLVILMAAKRPEDLLS